MTTVFETYEESLREIARASEQTVESDHDYTERQDEIDAMRESHRLEDLQNSDREEIEDGPIICPTCNGTGDNAYGNGICSDCRGQGEI